jgi:hypothetical protein
MTLQLVRPVITQSCILLAALSSCASHSPTTSSTAAMASPAIAGVLFCRGSRFCDLGFAGFGFLASTFSDSRFSGLGSFMNRTFLSIFVGPEINPVCGDPREWPPKPVHEDNTMQSS